MGEIYGDNLGQEGHLVQGLVPLDRPGDISGHDKAVTRNREAFRAWQVGTQAKVSIMQIKGVLDAPICNLFIHELIVPGFGRRFQRGVFAPEERL
jgi:hypothetical protein